MNVVDALEVHLIMKPEHARNGSCEDPDSSVIRRVECQSCRAHLGDTRALCPKFHGAKFAFTAFKASSVKLFDRAPLSRKKKWPQVHKMDPYCTIETRGTDAFIAESEDYLMDEVLLRMASKQRPGRTRQNGWRLGENGALPRVPC